MTKGSLIQQPDATATGIGPGSEGNESQPAGGSETFTQEQVNSMLAEQKRKDREKFADYEQLKADSKRLAEIEEASKSELQKAVEAKEKAEKELAGLKASAEIERARQKVSEETGIPASALRGADEDEIREHAEQLAELINGPASPVVRTDGKHPKSVKGNDAKSEFAAFMAGVRGKD